MTPEHAANHADRVQALWPANKIPHVEWVRAFAPIADRDYDGITVTGNVRVGKALTDFAARRQDEFPPPIGVVLGAIKDWHPPRPPRDIAIIEPAPGELPANFRLPPELCDDGLRHLEQFRQLARESADRARARRAGIRQDVAS